MVKLFPCHKSALLPCFAVKICSQLQESHLQSSFFGSSVLWEHLSPRPGVARYKRQKHIGRPLWNEWGIEDIKSCFFVKKYIWVLVSAGSARHWFNCSELPQCDLFCLYQTYALACNSVFHLFWCAITHMRAKVSLQRVRRLAALPAEPSDDNPHILLQPMTDNGALSCTVAKGQGDFPWPCRGFFIILLLEKMSEMWLKIVRDSLQNFGHYYIRVILSGHGTQKERKSRAPPSTPQPIGCYILKAAELHQMGMYVHPTNEAI